VGKISDKPIIGILGGIASGKSTVASLFGKSGCKVIDADKIAHKILEQKNIKKKIVDLFGKSVLDSTGIIDHRKLAQLVFTDAEKLLSLNEIIHPLVIEQTEELIKKYNRQDQVKAIVLDMPLLVEIGWAKRCDRLIFIDSSEKTRLDRANKLGYNKNQLKIRENFQISLDNKVALADNVVENNSDFSALVRQIADILSDIMDNG
jgi:dephospho-CoA kinase